MNRKFDFGWISTFREELFGLAIISIIIYHFTADFTGTDLYASASYGVRFFTRHYYDYIRSNGVEVFLILSGMGLYFAFSKNEKVLPFYKRRLLRVLPSYCLVGIVYWIIRDLVIRDVGVKEMMMDFSFVTFFTNGTVALWFIFAIIAFYLIYPVVYYLFKGKRHNVGMLILVLAIVMLGVLAIRHFAPDVYDNARLMWLRIASFVAGCYLGKIIKDGKQIPIVVAWVLCLVAILAKYVVWNQDWDIFIWRHYDVIFSLGIIVLLCLLLRLFKEAGIVRKSLRVVGMLSLELYITHVPIRWIFKSLGFHTSDIRAYVVVILISVILSLLIHKFATWFSAMALKKK